MFGDRYFAFETLLAQVESEAGAIRADDKPWDAPATLYLMRRLRELGGRKRLKVLQIGCGEGRTLGLVSEFGYVVYGCDSPAHREALRDRFAPVFKESFDQHIRSFGAEDSVPFEDGQFDVVYGSLIFQDDEGFERLVGESARVLRPDGSFFLSVPCIPKQDPDWSQVPPMRKLRGFSRSLVAGMTFTDLKGEPKAGVKDQDSGSNRDGTQNELQKIFSRYFAAWESETDHLVRAKIDMMIGDPRMNRQLVGKIMQALQGPSLDQFVNRNVSATFRLSPPVGKKATA